MEISTAWQNILFKDYFSILEGRFVWRLSVTFHKGGKPYAFSPGSLVD